MLEHGLSVTGEVAELIEEAGDPFLVVMRGPCALGAGGRLIAIHSHGNDPGMEIIQKVWPGDNPFLHDRHQIMKAVKHELVEILRRLENARSLAFYAGWAWQDRPDELAVATAAFRTAAGGAADHATRALKPTDAGPDARPTPRVGEQPPTLGALPKGRP